MQKDLGHIYRCICDILGHYSCWIWFSRWGVWLPGVSWENERNRG